MLSFLEWRITIPNRSKNKGILRKDMPQITDKDADHFINDFIKKKGVKVTVKKVNPKILKPLQKEFSDKGIEKNLGRIGPSYKKPPIIVSKDNYIMDGHHRWAAHANAKTDIEIRQIDMNSDELYKLMFNYSRTQKKDIYNVKGK